MAEDARKRLAALLGQAGKAVPGAARTAPTADLDIEVRGVGRVGLPVTERQAKQLCLVGRPARYGQGEQTLLDRRVRDTYEVPKSKVRIDRRRWDKTLIPMLDRLRADLGLPPEVKLRAELHSMLVYAQGQFFVRHQDSEKGDGMIASLVVTLPSRFTGGALVVGEAGAATTYRGSKRSLSFVAFYADCPHEVKPVRSGYRVVLTYNLFLRGAAGLPAEDDSPLVAELAALAKEHFGQPDAPTRLVYLLDHEYTQRGLDWSLLKGADATRSARLRAAAGQAGCDAVLALADVHETWSAYERDGGRSWYRGSRYRGWGRWDDGPDEDDEDEEDSWGGGPSYANGFQDYELEELIDSEVTLESWTAGDGAPLEKVGLPVTESEVCSSTPTDELHPYSSEYEGYMGNEGNTLDRWYHRGAVVLWPRSLAFGARAEASPGWALDDLSARARSRDLEGARSCASTVEPFWERAVERADKGKALFAKALRVALALEDPELAAMLLGPFQLELVGASHAKVIASLARTYGQRWLGALVAKWSGKHRRWYGHSGPAMAEWTGSLPALSTALCATGQPGSEIAQLLAKVSWEWASEEVRAALALAAPSRREKVLEALAAPLAALVRSASLAGATDVGNLAVTLLCRPDDDLVTLGVAALRSASKFPTSEWAGLSEVAAHCTRQLEARLAQPARAGDDWSMVLPHGCSCALCGTLADFLGSAGRRSMEWPLAKDGRAHVHSRIDAAELPVTHLTRRTGRPYTLVLTKTDDLFDRERAARRRDEASLACLKGRGATETGQRAKACAKKGAGLERRARDGRGLTQA